MKTTNIIIAGLFAFIAFAFTGKTDEYRVDEERSELTWTGRKVVGEHTGSIDISTGKLLWDGNKLQGGSFVIDMTSITNSDISDEETKAKLLGHLRSDDFFSTEKFPKAKFVITKSTPKGKNEFLIQGDLTIKGITKEITFPAQTEVQGDQLLAKATINVDRTAYGIRYGSGSFFDDLGDKAIDNEFELDVVLVAEQ